MSSGTLQRQYAFPYALLAGTPHCSHAYIDLNLCCPLATSRWHFAMSHASPGPLCRHNLKYEPLPLHHSCLGHAGTTPHCKSQMCGLFAGTFHRLHAFGLSRCQPLATAASTLYAFIAVLPTFSLSLPAPHRSKNRCRHYTTD